MAKKFVTLLITIMQYCKILNYAHYVWCNLPNLYLNIPIIDEWDGWAGRALVDYLISTRGGRLGPPNYPALDRFLSHRIQHWTENFDFLLKDWVNGIERIYKVDPWVNSQQIAGQTYFFLPNFFPPILPLRSMKPCY